MSLAHEGQPVAPHDLWTAWSWEPAAVAALAISAWLYARGVRRLWARAPASRPTLRRRAVAFAGGLLAVFVALVSPLDRTGSALFSAHMGQHLLLIVVAAPLLVLGAPVVPLLWALPSGPRRALGRGWRRATGLRAAWKAVSRPSAVWVVHAAAVWAWHLPTLYDRALRDDAVHALEHASFLGTAILFWWMLAQPAGRRRLDLGAGVLYVFTTAAHGGLLGALLTLAPRAWYPGHSRTTASWGLTPLEDQQLAGLLMWVPAGLVYLVAAGVLVVAWLRESDRRSAGRHAAGSWTAPVTSSRSLTGLALGAVALAGALSSGCGQAADARAKALEKGIPGDPVRGKQVVARYGCGACHIVPGVPGAQGLVGPPLIRFGNRAIIAGQLPNTPENLARWIMDPPAIESGTDMPKLGVSRRDATDIAAYLHTLE